jgi:hypothetical protein
MDSGSRGSAETAAKALLCGEGMTDRILVVHSTSVSYHSEPLFTCGEMLGVLVIVVT